MISREVLRRSLLAITDIGGFAGCLQRRLGVVRGHWPEVMTRMSMARGPGFPLGSLAE